MAKMKKNNLRLEDVEIGNETDAEMSVLAVFALGKGHSPQEDRTFRRYNPDCNCNPHWICSCFTQKEKEKCDNPHWICSCFFPKKEKKKFCDCPVNNKCDGYDPCPKDGSCDNHQPSCCSDYR